MRRFTLFTLGLMFCASLYDSVVHAEEADGSIERGRYLVMIAACNDCHTHDYAERAGQVPESEWLTGSSLGFQGPWGTSYPANLRIAVSQYSEEQFIAVARSELAPPMPWFNLVDMTDDDVKAIYRYIRSQGAAGEPAPAYVPPGIEPATPFIVFTPQEGSPTVASSQ